MPKKFLNIFFTWKTRRIFSRDLRRHILIMYIKRETVSFSCHTTTRPAIDIETRDWKARLNTHELVGNRSFSALEFRFRWFPKAHRAVDWIVSTNGIEHFSRYRFWNRFAIKLRSTSEINTRYMYALASIYIACFSRRFCMHEFQENRFSQLENQEF